MKKQAKTKKSQSKKKTVTSTTDRATLYAEAVTSGKIIAGPYVRGACQRHLNDLKNAGERGFYYDEKEAAHAIEFFEEKLCLNGGQFEGKPFILFNWESFIIGSIFGWKRKSDDMRRFRVAYIETPKGPLAIDTPIATLSGWTTMEKIKPGDKVFNSSGQITTVLGVSPIYYGRQCYKLRFSDGADIVADSEHEWYVSSLRNGKKPGPRQDEKLGEYEKRNTDYIAKTFRMPESKSKHPQAKWNHRVDVAPALIIPEIQLPIAPYTLGAWLGDGDSDAARITCEDEEIINNIQEDGYLVGNKHYKPNSKTFRQPIGIENPDKCRRGHIKIIGRKHCLECERLTDHARRSGKSVPETPPSSLNELLRINGLLYNKHIPEIYFRSGTSQRLALLQGIMDTDGHIANNGKCEITLCNKQLLYDVADLLRTLGYKCTIRESEAKINGKTTGRRWRIGFQAYQTQSPVRLQRKAANLSPEPQTRPLSRGRMIVSCEPVRSVPVRCITVASEDHMFLAGRHMIPTCNSGKSPLAAGIGLKGLCADKEQRAEVYAAATYKDQAMVLFRDAIAFYDQSPELLKRLNASGVGDKRWKLAYDKSNSFFKVISSEKKGQSGPRPHVVLLDEIHEHTDGTVIEMLRAGFKFRRQPLSFMITNSGHDKTSVCWEYHESGRKISCELEQNDEFFAYICSLDDDDLIDDKYLDDETLWHKVNPSLEYGLPGYDYIRGQITEARGMSSKMSTVKRLCFCVWTEADNPWISSEIWNPCRDDKFDESLLKGRRCWGALDLSATQDLTSLNLIFEPTEADSFMRLKSFFWMPKELIRQKTEVDHVPYDAWAANDLIFLSNGKTISKTQVVKFLYEASKDYDLQGVAYDRDRISDFREFAQIAEIEIAVGKWDKEKRQWDFDNNYGIKMMPFGQEAKSMAPAIDKIEIFLLKQEIKHNGHPVQTWCMANAVVSDAGHEGYRKIYKRKSVGRVDGAVTLIMAAGIYEKSEIVKSVYSGLTKEQMIARMTGK